MTNSFESAQNVFIDSLDGDKYINLSSSLVAYNRLLHKMEKSKETLLLVGEKGTGKSMLLNRLKDDLDDAREIYYFFTPPNTEKDFFYQLFKILTRQALPKNASVNFSALIEFCNTLDENREINILLDCIEAYNIELIEKIEIIAKTGAIQFIFSLSDEKNISTDQYFKSRIWDVIELENICINELSMYIEKKLLYDNLLAISNSIGKKQIRLIHSMTKGNFLATNLLMFTIFEICEYYDKVDASKLDGKYLSKKIIEMAGLKLGYLNV